MIDKYRKLSRYWAARLRPSHLPPMFWHIGAPNFGDDLNPALFESLTGVRVRFAKDRRVPHFLGMGSILGSATEASIVLGSGFLKPAITPTPERVVSVRGRLSKQLLGLADATPLGDPMVLINLLMSPERGSAIGFVPHITTMRAMRGTPPPGVTLIDVRRDPFEVTRDIGRCRLILSQSLHGLIVADAFEIPNIWIAPNDRMVGGEFKFHDYFSTLDAAKTPHELSWQLLDNPPQRESSVGVYTGHKHDYRALLLEAMTKGPAA
jgi:pyruvyltransferase